MFGTCLAFEGSLCSEILFRHHRFLPDVILCAVRWYGGYARSCEDVRDLLAEHGIDADASAMHRWVRRFGLEIAGRSFKHRYWRGLKGQADETGMRVGGRWCYLWRAVDQPGQIAVFRRTTRRDVTAARAFLKQAFGTARV